MAARGTSNDTRFCTVNARSFAERSGSALRLEGDTNRHTLNVGFTPIPSLQTDILDIELDIAVRHGVNRLFQRVQILPLQVFERMTLALAEREAEQEIAGSPGSQD